MKKVIKLDKDFFQGGIRNNDKYVFGDFAIRVTFDYYGDPNQLTLAEEEAIIHLYYTKTAARGYLYISRAGDLTVRGHKRQFYIVYEDGASSAFVLNHTQFELIEKEIEYETVDISVLRKVDI